MWQGLRCRDPAEIASHQNSKLNSCKTTSGLLLTHPDILCGSGVLVLWGMCAILAEGAIVLSVTLSGGALFAS